MDDTDEILVETLLTRDRNLFGQFFTLDGSSCNADPNMNTKAKEIFEEVNQDQSFEEFLEKWKKSKTVNINTDNFETLPTSQICNKLAFDTSNKRMVNVFGPRKKKNKSSDFDLIEFLRLRQEHKNTYDIHFPSDLDLESDLEVFLEPQKVAVIDAGLRKIARALTVLNSSCNYRLLEIHSERVIH